MLLAAKAEHRQLKRFAAPTAQNQKKKAKLHPEAQMRLGFRSFALPVDSKDNDRTGNALSPTLHHSPVSLPDLPTCPQGLVQPLSLE